MPWYFRKRKQLIPGVTLNFSKSGVSTTLGGRGLSLNLGKKGAVATASIPGTGVYYKKNLSSKTRKSKPETQTLPSSQHESPVLELESALRLITSDSLLPIQLRLEETWLQKANIGSEYIKARSKRRWLGVKRILSILLIFGLFIKSLKIAHKKAIETEVQAKKEFDEFTIEPEFSMAPAVVETLDEIQDALAEIIQCHVTWEITSQNTSDRREQVKNRSYGNITTESVRINTGFSRCLLFTDDKEYLSFHLSDRAIIFFFPAFLILYRDTHDFALIDYADIETDYTNILKPERAGYPNDARFIEYTWDKVNKNGQPDKRFKDNRQIPVVEYLDLFLISQTGLSRGFRFSNVEIGERFQKILDIYVNFMKDLQVH